MLPKLYDSIHISTEVYNEVAIAGAGLPGAAAVSKADWIHVMRVKNVEHLANTLTRIGLGAGEVSAVFLAKELAADLTLMDEWKGRRLAIEEGLAVVGCIGILEELYRRGEIKDLRKTYQELLQQNIRVDLRTLQSSLKQFGLAFPVMPDSAYDVRVANALTTAHALAARRQSNALSLPRLVFTPAAYLHRSRSARAGVRVNSEPNDRPFTRATVCGAWAACAC